MLEPLRHRDFRLLWIGQTVSMLGNGLYSVALPFQILQLGGTPLQLGTGFTVFSIAQLLTILFGGAIVDRLPRRRVILATDLLSAVVVGVLAALGLARHLTIVDLYVGSAFFGAAFSFYTPAMSAIMPELMRRRCSSRATRCAACPTRPAASSARCSAASSSPRSDRPRDSRSTPPPSPSASSCFCSRDRRRTSLPRPNASWPTSGKGWPFPSVCPGSGSRSSVSRSRTASSSRASRWPFRS